MFFITSQYSKLLSHKKTDTTVGVRFCFYKLLKPQTGTERTNQADNYGCIIGVSPDIS